MRREKGGDGKEEKKKRQQEIDGKVEAEREGWGVEGKGPSS